MEQCRPPNLEEEEEQEEFKNPYHRSKCITERLKALGTLTTKYCRDALAEEGERIRLLTRGVFDFPVSFMEQNARAKYCVQNLLSQWTEFYVAHMEEMREIQNLKLADGRLYSTTLGANVFYEISRLHWLRDRPRAALEWENTQLIEADELVPRNYDVLFSLAHTEGNAWIAVMTSVQEEQAKANSEVEHAVAARELKERLLNMWNKPISQYNVSETRALAMFLTQYLNDVKETQLVEFGRVFRLLWLRCTELSVSQYQKEEWSTTLDEEEFRIVVPPEPLGSGSLGPKGPEAVANRRYAAFCSFYLGEVTRRFFHHEELSPNRLSNPLLPSPELLGRMRTRMHGWIHHIVGAFAEEAFEEMYMSIVTGDDGGYAYPGDAQWFRYAFPQRMPSRGAIVTTLRPHMYGRFFSEAQVDRRLVVEQSEHSHLARLFILRAVDEHIRITHPRVQWINGVVIDNEGIELSAYALKGSMAPLLVQPFSSYWVYHAGQVYPTDDLFVTLALWWWFLREHYESRLYNVDLMAFMSETLEPPDRGDGDEEEAMDLATPQRLEL